MRKNLINWWYLVSISNKLMVLRIWSGKNLLIFRRFVTKKIMIEKP